MKIIDRELLDYTTAEARTNDRLRQNYNFHTSYDEPVQRMLNAMEPGSYIPAHRHTQPPRSETIIVLRGAIAACTYDDNGQISCCRRISPDEGKYGYDITAGEWHALAVLDPETAVMEIKPGPFTPIATIDLAPWNPPADDRQAIAAYIERIVEALNKQH